MYKEVVITSIIIVLVAIGNFFTQKYTGETIGYMNNKLDEVRERILTKEYEKEEVTSIIADIEKEWEDKHDYMLYYLDHNELEKVTAQLFEIKAYAEIDKSDESIPYIDNCKVLLKNINEKAQFNFKNIF